MIPVTINPEFKLRVHLGRRRRTILTAATIDAAIKSLVRGHT